MKEVAELNREYGVDNELGFCDMTGEPLAWIRNDACAATIALKGAQLVSWYPYGHDEVFWVSSIRPSSSAMSRRGGVPVCWPWFGPHPTDPTKPQHGFVRNRRWAVVSTNSTSQITELTLRTETKPEDAALWPHQAEVSLRFVAGATLCLELTTRNTGARAFELTEALHSYFRVSDIAKVTIEGFDGLDYLDKVDGYARKRQSGLITITGETDRIYLGHTGAAVIHDSGLGRGIVITKSGSTSSVVWNPWEERARQIGDLGENGYRRMVCVETANAGDDVVHIDPGHQHTLVANIQIARG
jgi:D-hexose-6-phosphate mutarotase